MSRKPTLPGVDEKALASLASMFPPVSAENTARSEPAAAAPEAPATPQRVAAAPAEPVAPAPAAAPSTAAVPWPDADAIAAPAAEAFVEGPRGSRTVAVLALVVSLTALVVAGFAIAPQPMIARLQRALGPNPMLDVLTDHHDAINAQLAADGAAIKALETRLGAAQAQDEAIRAVTARLNALQQQDAAVSAALKALTDRLDATEILAGETAARVTAADGTIARSLDELAGTLEAAKRSDGRAERFYLAALQLRGATQSSLPYGRELAVVSGAAGTDMALAGPLGVLAAHAEAGVPTLTDLRLAFAKTVLSRIPPAMPVAPSLSSRGVAWVRSMVPGGGASRADTSELRNGTAVAMAERSLADGQLAAAVDQLLLLEDRAALLASEWLRDAGARLAVDKAAASVVDRAFDRLTAVP